MIDGCETKLCPAQLTFFFAGYFQPLDQTRTYGSEQREHGHDPTNHRERIECFHGTGMDRRVADRVRPRIGTRGRYPRLENNICQPVGGPSVRNLPAGSLPVFTSLAILSFPFEKTEHLQEKPTTREKRFRSKTMTRIR